MKNDLDFMPDTVPSCAGCGMPAKWEKHENGWQWYGLCGSCDRKTVERRVQKICGSVPHDWASHNRTKKMYDTKTTRMPVLR